MRGSFKLDLPPSSQSTTYGTGDPSFVDDPARRTRTLTTPNQQRRLMMLFEETQFPSTAQREVIAFELGMTPRRVQVWFQNRRQNLKKRRDDETSFDSGSLSRASSFSDLNDDPVITDDLYTSSRVSENRSTPFINPTTYRRPSPTSRPSLADLLLATSTSTANLSEIPPNTSFKTYRDRQELSSPYTPAFRSEPQATSTPLFPATPRRTRSNLLDISVSPLTSSMGTSTGSFSYPPDAGQCRPSTALFPMSSQPRGNSSSTYTLPPISTLISDPSLNKSRSSTRMPDYWR